MRHRRAGRLVAGASYALLLLLVLLGTGAGKEPNSAPALPLEGRTEEPDGPEGFDRTFIERMDTNKDGRVESDEFASVRVNAMRAIGMPRRLLDSGHRA